MDDKSVCVVFQDECGCVFAELPSAGAHRPCFCRVESCWIEMKICDQSSKNGQHGFAYFCYRGTGGNAAATETCGSGYCMIKASASVDKGTHEMDINRGEETEFTADDTKFGGCKWDAKNGSLDVKVPHESSSLVRFILLKTGLDPEFSTSTFPVYGIVLIVVGIVVLVAILITVLYCKVIKPRMARKNDPTTKDLEANVQGKPQTTASSKQEERKASEPVQKPMPPFWPAVVDKHIKTEEKSWVDSAKHNMLRERKEKMERRNALERERKEREEALEKKKMEEKKKRAEEKAEEERRRQISIEKKIYSSEDQKLSKQTEEKPAKMRSRTKDSRESVTIEPRKTTVEGRTTEEGKGKKIATEWKKFMEEKGGVVTFEQEAEEERKAKKEKKKKEGSEEEDEN
uniref:Uncharacterized protein n=1 Tax=Panagrolaimus sp. JU765 TaxID=591449 RepID=A0AC34PYY1_9BILA